MSSVFQDSVEAAKSTKREPQKAESWKRSVGTLSSKGSLANLVKKKPTSKVEANKSSASVGAALTKSSTSSSTNQTISSTDTQRLVATALSKQAEAQVAVKISAANGLMKTGDKASSVAGKPGDAVASPAATVSDSSKGNVPASATGSALGLLGGYSGSDSDSS